MDRSLWLLGRLRFVGWLRRWFRNLGTPKRAILAVIGALMFLPVPLMAILAPHVGVAGQVAVVRRFGPLGLFLNCLLNVFLAGEDRVVTFSPAEVNFLFPGPYRPREILFSKIVATLLTAVFTAFFLTCVLAHHSPSFVSAFVGLVIAVEFLFLFTLAVGQFISLVGALAFNRQRRVLIGLALVGLAAVLAPATRAAGRLDPWELLQAVERSPVSRFVSVPFRPFLLAFTAERVWPDLVLWGLVGAAIDAALLGLILVLNDQYLEASAIASAKFYARLRRAGAVGSVSARGRGLARLPDFPWWGGIGPNLWRQATTAIRSPVRIVTVLVLSVFPILTVLSLGISVRNDTMLPRFLLGITASLTCLAPAMVPFDFRLDLDRMEELKTWPIPPARLVLGQLLVPVAILSLGEWLVLAISALFLRVEAPLLFGAFLLFPTLNLLFVGIENLFFLWYPFRLASGSSVDFLALGRQMLLMFAKLAAFALVAGVAGGLGAIAYFGLGENWTAALAAAWLPVAAAAAGTVPLVAQAFDQFDIARDVPA